MAAVVRKRPRAAAAGADAAESAYQFPKHVIVCPTGLTFGSDFAGLDICAWALKILGVEFRHIFSCDKLPASQSIGRCLGAAQFYKDVLHRPDPPSVDFYCFAAPCQPFSKSGKKLGTDDPVNGELTLAALAFIVQEMPDMILLEQVPEIKSGKHKEIYDVIMGTLRQCGYKCTEIIAQSEDFGVPQRRARLYIGGTLRKEPAFQLPPRRETSLSMIITPMQGSNFNMLPGNDSTKRARTVVEKQVAKFVKTGTNIFEVPILVNAGASHKFAHSSADIAMTVTKSDASKRMYWCSTKGGYLDADETALLQGIPKDLIPWRELGISENMYCGMVGNAMTLPVVVCFIPALLEAAGKVTPAVTQELYKRAFMFMPVK